MSHKINLEKYQIRTDLTIEGAKKFKNCVEEKDGDIKVTTIDLDKNEGKKINKKAGRYITIQFEDITDFESSNKVKKVFTKEIKKMLKYLNISDDDSCFIAGLGNSASTPDALGPKTIDNILVTRHLFELSLVEDGFRCVSAIKPSVMGTTGIEASDILKGVIDIHKPAFLIVIDALASSSIERVNKTIQISSAGINPGSGVGNSRKEISKDVLNIPVVAIGVPTVVDAVTIVSDTINYMYKKYSYEKQNIHNPARKLAIASSNYLKKEVEVTNEDKKSLFGLIGNLDDNEVYSLINEVLSPVGYNLMVTPKEVDFQIDKLSILIGNGLNNALHKKVDSM